ncbi:MAG TPA: BREX system ATP-binding domain-containing protein [Pyrinomonadaceae bacterium]|nr:BREX system ATP-binding domain-containing protein [Pyrinomonadaceae bacterium]
MIRQLAGGTTPLDGVPYLNVGRERYFVEIVRLLEDLDEGGGAAVHFLNADYGYGKTHFIGMTNALALERNWVTSYVKLSKADGVRLDKFEQLYAAILRNCICRGLLEAHQHTYDPGEKNGWPWILDDWLGRHVNTEAKSGIDPNSLGARERTLGALELLLRKANVTGDFAAAVLLYGKTSFERTSTVDRQLRDDVLRWFGCEKITSLREHGIFAPITSANAKQVLRCIIGILREFGYAGMAVFIDEADSVNDYTKSQRRVAYQNLRELLDNMDGRATGMSLNHAVCYVAATPVMFVGEHGFREYPALQDRIDDIILSLPDLNKLIDYRAVVIDLALSPLTRLDRCELAKKIRYIHSVCHQWSAQKAVDDNWLDSLVEAFDQRRGEQGGLRPLCKAIAKALELAHQHPVEFSRLEPRQIVAAAFQPESV